jgi:hypothetical protein
VELGILLGILILLGVLLEFCWEQQQFAGRICWENLLGIADFFPCPADSQPLNLFNKIIK